MLNKINKYFKNFIFGMPLVIMLLICSCDDDSGNGPILRPELITTDRDTTFPGDVLTIYGSNLGQGRDGSYLLFSKVPEVIKDSSWIDTVIVDSVEQHIPRHILIIDSIMAINAEDCQLWNNSMIKAKLPRGLTSGTFTVVVDKDTANRLPIIILPHPPYPMVDITPGTFFMGSESGFEDEQPVHEITISQGFSIGRCEVSQQFWITVSAWLPDIDYQPDRPVYAISWYEAIIFCNTVSKLHNLDTCYIIDAETVTLDISANGYRLPSEAEWEYACRAGSTSDYSGPGTLDQIAWYRGNSGGNPQPCGTKSANSFGIFDMHGNIWEWCYDFYMEGYYAQSQNTDPLGPDSGDRHVLRGGAANSGIAFVRSACRRLPDSSLTMTGLRLVRSAE